MDEPWLYPPTAKQRRALHEELSEMRAPSEYGSPAASPRPGSARGGASTRSTPRSGGRASGSGRGSGAFQTKVQGEGGLNDCFKAGATPRDRARHVP
jgi:hypothetical protein